MLQITSFNRRMAQYESGTRTPKENYVTDIANALDVSPKALDLPDIESYVGLAHTLFALEDLYGIQIGEIDGEVCLRLDKTKGSTYLSMFDIFHAWNDMAVKLKNGEITKAEYDQWRYRYPELDTTGQWVKIPSVELSDALVKELRKD